MASVLVTCRTLWLPNLRQTTETGQNWIESNSRDFPVSCVL